VTKPKTGRPRGKANKPADDHEFKAPEYARQQVTSTVDYKHAWRKFLSDSREAERRILAARGW